MTFTVIIIVVVLLVVLGGGAVIWFFRKQAQVTKSAEPTEESTEPVEKTTAGQPVSFRWRYVILPIVVLVVTIILTAIFHPRLPAEVAVRFASDGSPDKWFSREITLVLALVPQFIITLLAAGMVWGVVKSRTLSTEGSISWIEPRKLLWYMGNMGALLQLVMLYVMVQIFVYNAFQIQIMSVWIFAVIVMAVGGIFVGVFFIQAMRRSLWT